MTAIQPELWADRGRAAATFYESAFGATLLHQVGEDDDIVAQLAVGDAAFWIASTGASTERLVPRAIGAATGRVLLMVDDLDAVFARAAGRGRSGSAIGRASADCDDNGWRAADPDPSARALRIGRERTHHRMADGL